MTTSTEFEQLNKFQSDLDKCTKCGFCMSHCPVYQEERIESSVARGKIMLIRALLSGELTATDEMAEQLNRCTLCMTCAQNCPASTQVPSVVTTFCYQRGRQDRVQFRRARGSSDAVRRSSQILRRNTGSVATIHFPETSSLMIL